MSAPVLVSADGAVGILELARPDKFNCLSMATWRLIGESLASFEEPGSGVRVVLIRAQGKHFCTGADLDEVQGLRADRAGLDSFLHSGHDVLRAMEASPLPIVAACQGLCLAGGLELMLGCDTVFAARGARFGDQHAQFGLIPGWGGSQRLTRLVGLRRAMDLFCSARWLEADTALAWGLVNEVVDTEALHEHALAWCRTAATRSASGLAAMKRLAREGLDQPLAQGLALEIALAVDALQDTDVSEGLAAFQARRTPAFKAR
ncbi:enoyl-CoA hydratase/isomerase family protein [Algiphilus sp. W345]|uniref:Enoyl-CoA hydratase/isomerase family protein n=1 Tax=Banduia mediterranea TaxID=3075609 RepID=A0ABU2WE91_9GAMM|nr:enoyl-CoA hydratase/isomerase family protein [Algiphilus sp. W345]MDT0496191.1 enoyl-CoA hydratase/isomerase family protein [Algiphilus sp. W345]